MKNKTEWKVAAIFVSVHWTALLLSLVFEELCKKFLGWSVSPSCKWICITGLMVSLLAISEYYLIPNDHARRIKDIVLFLSASLAVLWFILRLR